MSRKSADRDDGMTHRYTGPTTRWGLVTGSRCKVVAGGRGGGRRIRTSAGAFIVGPQQIAKLKP